MKKAVVTVIIFLIIVLLALVFLKNYHQKNTKIITYPKTDDVLINPLMGFAPWASMKKEYTQPHTLVYADLTWRELEPSEGVFDFESFEQENNFDKWRREGKRVVFRFLLDYPRDYEHKDIPDWLYEKIDGAGTHYDHSYGKGFSPDYSNEILIAYHKKAIEAIANRYADDDFIAFIELGSLGHWGEWHINLGTGIKRMPSEEVRNQYVYHYTDVFTITQLLMRRPFNIAKELGLGLFNDVSAHPEDTNEWLSWIENGGAFEQTYEYSALSSMPDAWKKAPIGGEINSTYSDAETYGTMLSTTVDLFKKSHTTFIGPKGADDVKQGSELQAGVDKVLATIGYRFRVSKAVLAKQIFSKDYFLDLHFTNDGIAPFYYDWKIMLYLLDENLNSVYSEYLDVDIKSILPHSDIVAKAKINTENLSKGNYTLAVAIIDQSTSEPAIAFGMDSEIKNSKIYKVVDFELK